jgi:hypothetical protein
MRGRTIEHNSDAERVARRQTCVRKSAPLGGHRPRKGTIQYAAASQLSFAASGILDRQIEPGDDS